MALLLRSAEIQPLFARFVPIGLCSGHPHLNNGHNLSPTLRKILVAATLGVVEIALPSTLAGFRLGPDTLGVVGHTSEA